MITGRINRRWLLSCGPLVAVLSFLFLLSNGVAQTKKEVAAYTITDLGALEGLESFAWAINDRGQVIGTWPTATGEALMEDCTLRQSPTSAVSTHCT